MIALILVLLCALYFLYLTQWAKSLLSKEYNFGSPSPPEPLPHSPTLSVMVGVLWGILLVVGPFWGFTFNRYPAHLSIHDPDIEIVLRLVLCASIGLSYLVVYRMGEINGVANMKNTDLFRTCMQDKGA
jgi:hypothetical protein